MKLTPIGPTSRLKGLEAEAASIVSTRTRAMPLTRMKDDYIMSDGVKFWMADEGRPVLCRVTHEALRDHADRVRLNVADDKVFEAYRELIEQVASDAYDAGANVDDAGCVLVNSEALDRVSRST